MSHCSEPSENRRLNEADFLRLFREQCPKPEQREVPGGPLGCNRRRRVQNGRYCLLV